MPGRPRNLNESDLPEIKRLLEIKTPKNIIAEKYKYSDVAAFRRGLKAFRKRIGHTLMDI
jgi:hypothetical protein